jgi:hypothetical protein
VPQSLQASQAQARQVWTGVCRREADPGQRQPDQRTNNISGNAGRPSTHLSPAMGWAGSGWGWDRREACAALPEAQFRIHNVRCTVCSLAAHCS